VLAAEKVNEKGHEIILHFTDSENFELDSFEEVVEIKNDNRKENDKRSSEIIPPKLITEENLTEEPPTLGTTKNNLESQKAATEKSKQQSPTKSLETITKQGNTPQDNQKSPVLPQQPQIEKIKTLQSTKQPEAKKEKKETVFIFLSTFLMVSLVIGLIIKYMNYLDKEEKERKKIECQKIAGKAVAKILQQLKKEIKIDNTGKNLEEIAKKLMEKNQVKSSSFGYRDFPAYICVSLNNELTHGIPDPRPFQTGDLVSIDVACSYQGYHADAAVTVIVGKGDKKKKDLLKVTKNSLYYAIQNIQPNITTTQDIGNMLEKYIRSRGYYPIKEYGGHGIGENLHEEPFVPNYKIPHKGKVIREGMTICIEPLVQIGDNKISLSANK
jgi:methionyl aminopeptidase